MSHLAAAATFLSVVALAPLTASQQKLTTTFNANNQGSVGGAVYFDVTASQAVRLLAMDLNFDIGAGAPVGVDVYLTALGGTHVGNEASTSAWTLVAAGSATSAGRNSATTCTLSPVPTLDVGTYGVALVARGAGHAYTNGANTFSDATLSLDLGSASNAPFAGPTFGSRTANVTLCYESANGLFPEFEWSPRSGIAPLNVQFVDRSQTSDPGGILTWAWDFDNDGQVDSVQPDPSFTFVASGRYTVVLTVTDSMHGSRSKTVVDAVLVDVVDAQFEVDRRFVPNGVNVQFTDASTGGATSWSWDFDGDGQSDSTRRNPVHAYAAPGVYAAELTASNALTSDTYTMRIEVAAATPHEFGAGVLELQFNEGFGTEISNVASTSLAPAVSTVPAAGWQGNAQSAVYGGNFGGGALRETGNFGDNVVSTGWALDARDLTICWWHRPGSAAASSSNPFAYVFGGPGGDMRAFYGGAAGNSLMYRGTSVGDFAMTSDVITGRGQQWQHHCLVIDDQRGQAAWYVDGVLDASTTFAPGSHRVTNQEFKVAGHDGPFTYCAFYSMDDFRFYRRALSAAEVQAIVAKGGENAAASPYGVGCAGGSQTPRIFGSGAPFVGNASFAVELRSADPGAAASLVMGYNNATFGGLPLPLDLSILPGFQRGSSCRGYVGDIVFGVPITTSGGAGGVPLPVPNAPVMIGGHVYVQSLVLGTPFSASNALDLNVQS